MAANLDTTAQMRFMATVRRQSAPPRCNPFVIVLQVLALGMVFIGATMTVIAHWPGSTSIGENPLRIAGPIILAVGLVALVIGIVFIAVGNSSERVRWQKQMAKAVTSRQVDDAAVTDGVQMQRIAAPAAVYPTESEVRSRPYGAAPEDPYAKPVLGYHDDSADMNDSAVMDGDNIPMPVRVKKARRQKDKSGEEMSSSEDLTATGEVDADEFGNRTGTTEAAAAPKKRRRPKANTTQEENEALMRDVSSDRPVTDSQAVQPSPGEARRLKVHIKAQPGASVHIQNAPPPVAPKPAYRPKPHDISTTSAETDI